MAETRDFTHKFGTCRSPPVFFGNAEKQGPALRACFSRPPPRPLIHTGSKGPPPPELQWTAGLLPSTIMASNAVLGNQ